MKIVHWAKYYPPEWGGMESVTQSLARGMAALGDAVQVVCFSRTAHAEEWLDGVRVTRIGVRRVLASQPLHGRYAQAGWAAARGADVVHLHAPNMQAAVMALLLPRRVRLVVHWHADVVGKGLLGRLVRPLERAMLRRADAVIATSPSYGAGSLPLQAIPEKVRIIPLGLAEPKPAGALPEEIERFLAGRRLLLSVGRLVAYKGFDVVIRAAQTLDPGAAVVIVGAGPLSCALQAHITASGVADRVLLAGRQDESALAALFGQAAVYIMASVDKAEAFGVVLLEAMAHGVPIIATDIPGSGVPWVNAAGESGVNVRPGDADALAQAANHLLADESDRQRLARGARARYEALFTEQRAIAATRALYHGDEPGVVPSPDGVQIPGGARPERAPV